jgi:hypothetical protein
MRGLTRDDSVVSAQLTQGGYMPFQHGAWIVDLLELRYTAQTVALATGATSKQITDWCGQGLIIGQREPLGKGHHRSFSWFNLMEVASALALMEIGVKSPGDAFRAAQRFAHMGNGGFSWAGDDDALKDSDPARHPALPYHHREGETFLYFAGGRMTVALHKDGIPEFDEINRALGNPPGFIALNLSALFAGILHRMARDYREVLDEAYPDQKAA